MGLEGVEKNLTTERNMEVDTEVHTMEDGAAVAA